MRVPKKSTGTCKNTHFFLPIFPAFPAISIFPALPILPAFSIFPALPFVPPIPLVPPVPPIPPIPPILPIPPIPPVSPVPALPILPALSVLSEKKSFIASLYFRYRKDTGSPKDYRKMSEVQTSNHYLKTRKISYSSPIHNLSNFLLLPAFLAFLFLPLTKKIPSYC